MTDKYDNQRVLHKFLVAAFENQRRFTKQDLTNETQYKALETNWSKHVLPLLESQSDDTFVVAEVFRRFLKFSDFQRNVVSQTRRFALEYSALTHANVMIFEFFMPLANETYLRASLDALFYRDTVVDRLTRVSSSGLTRHFPKTHEISEEKYFDDICDWIQKRFGGYSITHVNGRFRAEDLLTRTAAAKHSRYLVDETTAVVRFIFPCGTPVVKSPPLRESYFEELFDEPNPDEHVQNEAMKIRWVFGAIFVRSIVQIASGEDVIWMLESGMRSRLHIWQVVDDSGLAAAQVDVT